MKKIAIVLTLAAFIGLGAASVNSISNVNANNVVSTIDTTKAKKSNCTTAKSNCTTSSASKSKADCEKTKCATAKKSCCPGDKK